MAYINPGPGTAEEVVLTLSVNGIVGDLVVPALQDITVSASNDIFTWSQLDETAKLQVATTSTNSVSGNMVLDPTAFFGNATATAGSAAKLGCMGLSVNKTKVEFDINMGTKTLSGIGYVTGLSPSVSADSPVWVSPFTLTVSGEYTIA